MSAPTPAPTALIDSIYLQEANMKSTSIMTTYIGWLIPAIFVLTFCCLFPCCLAFFNRRSNQMEDRINQHFIQKRDEQKSRVEMDFASQREQAMKMQFKVSYY